MSNGLTMPYRGAMPPLADEERDALMASIAREGVRVPCVATEDGRLLDGHNRLDADPEGPVARLPGTRLWSDEDCLAWIFRNARERRNLTGEQKATVREKEKAAARVLRERSPRLYTQERLAEMFGVGRATMGEWLSNSAGSGEVGQATRPTAIPRDEWPAVKARVEAGESLREVAEDFHVSPQTVSNVVARLEAPEPMSPPVPRDERLVPWEPEDPFLATERRLALLPAATRQPEWSIIEGDCLDVLAKIAPGSVRLAFADPPYNIGVDYGDGAEADALPGDAFDRWLAEWAALVRDALTPDGSLWLLISDEHAAEACVSLKRIGFTIRSWIKWHERFGVNCQDKFNRTSRHLFYATRSARRFVFDRSAVSRPSDRAAIYGDSRAAPEGKILDDVWDDVPRLAGTHSERLAGFPTQLPLKLLRRVVACASERGDTVADPFNGSGTTGAAALALGRRYIGIEKQERSARLARLRLRSVEEDIRDGDAG